MIFKCWKHYVKAHLVIIDLTSLMNGNHDFNPTLISCIYQISCSQSLSLNKNGIIVKLYDDKFQLLPCSPRAQHTGDYLLTHMGGIEHLLASPKNIVIFKLVKSYSCERY